MEKWDIKTAGVDDAQQRHQWQYCGEVVKKILRIYRLGFSANLGGNTHITTFDMYAVSNFFFIIIIYFYYIHLFFFVCANGLLCTRLSGLVYNPSYLLFPRGVHGAAGQNNTTVPPTYYIGVSSLPQADRNSSSSPPCLTPPPTLFMTVTGTGSFIVPRYG